MSTENYDDLIWDISDFPIGSSTPDDLFEMSYRAEARCPMCNGRIEGTAYYWSRYSDMGDMWLERIRYQDCECNSDESELEDYLTD